MTKKEHYRLTIEYFLEHMPQAETEFVYAKPYVFNFALPTQIFLK